MGFGGVTGITDIFKAGKKGNKERRDASNNGGETNQRIEEGGEDAGLAGSGKICGRTVESGKGLGMNNGGRDCEYEGGDGG